MKRRRPRWRRHTLIARLSFLHRISPAFAARLARRVNPPGDPGFQVTSIDDCPELARLLRTVENRSQNDIVQALRRRGIFVLDVIGNRIVVCARPGGWETASRA